MPNLLYCKSFFIVLILSSILFSCTQKSSQNSKKKETPTPIDSSKVAVDSTFINAIVNKEELVISFQKKDGLYISFRRTHPDSAFNSISFGSWSKEMLQQADDATELQQYISNIDYCWSYIEQMGSIRLSHIRLRPPSSYPDVLKNQVQAFNEDKEWKQRCANEKNDYKILMQSESYKLAAEIMRDYDVYQPINQFLKQKGLEIAAYSMEKMGSVAKEKQKEMGIEKPALVPVPSILYIKVKKAAK